MTDNDSELTVFYVYILLDTHNVYGVVTVWLSGHRKADDIHTELSFVFAFEYFMLSTTKSCIGLPSKFTFNAF